MNILRATILFASLLAASPASPAPLLSSRMETGWTSNAEGRAGGSADSYVTHAHEIGLAAQADGLDLRGTIAFEETRYLSLWRENDWTGSARIEAETLLSPHTGLRGSLALGYGEEGQSLATEAGPLGLVMPTLSGAASLRAETLLGDTVLGLDLGYFLQRPGRTRFEGDLLAPARTRPATDTLIAGIDLSHPLTPSAALAARARLLTVHVPAPDQEAFGRVPVAVARAGLGLDLGAEGPVSLSLRGGVDVIMPDAPSLPALQIPYAELGAHVALAPPLALEARFRSEADTEDPADGLADWTLEARGSILFAPHPDWGLKAGIFAAQTRSPALSLALETERGAEIVAQWAPRDGIVLSALARHRWVEGLAPAYEETRLGLRISAAI